MADQHNPNIPNAANVIAEDLVDIKENIEFHKDCFQALCDGWSDSSVAALAVKADTVATAMIQDDAVDNDKLANDAVDSDQIADGSVDAVHLASNAVETAKIKDANVTQAKLKTSTGSVSTTTSASFEKEILPGGTYGFYPQTKMSAASGTLWEVQICGDGITGFTTYATIAGLKATAGGTIYVQQRYVTSSGEVFWIFILRDKLTKKISSVWQAPDHPCFGSGGKPLLRPHPYLDFDETKHEIIVINPSKEQVLEMQEKTIVDSETEPDKDLIEVILEEYNLDEKTEPDWPAEEVTVGIPKEWEETPIGGKIKPIKKVIPKPSYIKTASLRLKKKAKVI